MLIIVSNRVPDPHGPDAGGLAVALQGVLRERGGKWIGWSGNTHASSAFGATPSGTEVRVNGVDLVTLDLEADLFEGYYAGFSNRVLWPLMHFRPDLMQFVRGDLEAYLEVNRLFSQAVAAQLGPEDVIWVHDYHLLPLASLLRDIGVGNRIGFFLHIPVASPELLRMLPGHEQTLGALRDYDLVGVQTRGDAERLSTYFHEADEGARREKARHPRIEVHPIGIDTAHVESLARRAPTHPETRRLRESLVHKRLVIGVDRLDYSKGLPERFLGFGRYLETGAPKGQVSFLQIAPPSRGTVPEYQDLRHELERHAGHINGLHAQPDWVPIRYLNASFPHEVLTGFYRLASVGLVTPLRDGMNLVAKEFVAAQDPSDPGVLILSRFAGAADELANGALLVNPHDVEEIAEALHEALALGLRDRRRRWSLMMEALRAQSVQSWGEAFLESLVGRIDRKERGAGPCVSRRSEKGHGSLLVFSPEDSRVRSTRPADLDAPLLETGSD